MKNLSNEEQITLILIGIAIGIGIGFLIKVFIDTHILLQNFLKKSLDLYTFYFVALHRI